MDLLPRSKEEFREKQYWDSFFKKRSGKAFEWYGEYNELCGVLCKYMKPADSVLVAGCGNSKLSQDLYDVGYCNSTSVDISDVVIAQLQKEHRSTRPAMKFYCADLHHTQFDDKTYTCILDKGTTDALCTDSSQLVQDDVHSIYKEYSRLLRVGGRLICISLLQQHVACIVLSWLHQQHWMIRVVRCHDAEKPSGSGGLTLPVFAIIATKFKHIPNMKPIIEIDLENKIERLSSLDDLLLHIQSIQRMCIVQYRIASQHITDEEPVSLELVSPHTQAVRYIIHVVDHKSGKSGPFAVFIVPHGRESEWLFGSVEGRGQLCATAGYKRLLVAHLQRSQEYDSLQAVQDELSPHVVQLKPYNMKTNYKVPFLSEGSSLGSRTSVVRGVSELSGEYIVEDVEFNSGEWYRRLVFLSNVNAIQSEAKLNNGGSGGIDHSTLCCEHHTFMVSGLSLSQHGATGSTLLLGLGGGSLAAYIYKHFPKVCLTAIELDSCIVDIATQHFDLKLDARLTVHVDDALLYIDQASTNPEVMYDVILMDVDSKDLKKGLSFPPKAFLQPDTLQKIHQILSDTGCLVINFACRSAETRKSLLQNLDVFSVVYSYQVPEQVNEVLYALKQTPKDSTNKQQILKHAKHVFGKHKHDDAVNDLIKNIQLVKI